MRLVIADDDRLFAGMVRAGLAERREVEIVGIADNGLEAVALVEEFEPDLVLMDVNMPVMDGIEATRLIHELVDAPAVILITGDDDAADARAYEAGAAAYLRKSADLLSALDMIVAVSRLAASNA